MSLRTRVIAAVIVIAIAVVGVGAYLARTTEANLVEQVDEQLSQAVQPVRNVDFGPGGGQVDPRRRPREPSLSSLYVGLVADDAVTTIIRPGLRRDELPLPDLGVDDIERAASTGETFTSTSVDSDLRWRVRAYASDERAATLVIGLPLDTVDDTMGDLIALELGAGLVIFAALALVAVWVIRLGVRPVKEMTEVATAIADGDLTQRVADTNSDTEAGQLGDALNRMLANIETSFTERQRIADQLRQFVADASHELRTPVATIRGYAELYRAGGLDDDGRLDDAMRRTEEESIRMGGLVEDLLALARLDEGRPLERTTVDVATVVADAAADARARVPSRTITVDAAPVSIAADEDKIRQVVANLVANSLVHTPDDAEISLRAGPLPDGGAFIEVHDTGPGMPPDVAEHVFERFYRADASRSRHRGGSGLGLSIVDATVAAHGGSVRLDTEPGSHTTVRIELPGGTA